MANYATLKAAIIDVVKTNGNNEITGALLQQILVSMVNSLADGYIFKGIASVSTNPGTPDQNVFYISDGPGTFSNFGPAVVPNGKIGIFRYNGSWNMETMAVGKDYDSIIYGDSIEQPGSSNLNNGYMTGGGMWQAGGNYWSVVIDVSNLRGKHLTQSGSSGGQYAFLKTIATTQGAYSQFVDGGGRVTGNLSNTLIPSDANYLYIYMGQSASAPSTYPTLIINDAIIGILPRLQTLEDEFEEIDINSLGQIIDAVNELNWQPATGKDYIFNGNSSVAILRTPIVLSQNGDSIEIELSAASGNVNPYGYGFSQGNGTAWRGIAASGSAWSVRADDGTWILTSNGRTHTGKIKISYENGNIVFSSPGVTDATYTGQKTLTIARFGYSPLIGSNPKYWTGTIKSIKVNGQLYDLLGNATLTDVNYTPVAPQRSFLTDSEKSQLDKTIKVSSKTVDGVSSISVFVPQLDGYLEYLLLRYVSVDANADTWLVYYAFKTDENFIRSTQVTTIGNWECAIKLNGRPDFAGGIAHGSEKMNSVVFVIDGKVKTFEQLNTLTDCRTFRILLSSSLYDPNDETTIFAKHTCEYNFTKDGLHLRQTVNWIVSETLAESYLAMFPAAQNVTDRYNSDKDFEPVVIPAGGMNQIVISNTKHINIWGQNSGVFVDFAIGDYPGYVTPTRFLGHNNGGTSYNKLYFYATLAGGGTTVNVGDVWKSETIYKISL